MALEDLRNPATNYAGLGGYGDDACNRDYNHDIDVDGDGSTCRTLSRPWPLAGLEGCSPPKASYSRSPETLR